MRAKRMTIFVGESDQWHHQPLYLAILGRLKAAGCAGATVLHGIAGFGADSRIHTATILRLSEDLPVLITAVDAAERIDRLLPEVSGMLAGGLVIVDEVEIYFHSAAFRGGLPDVRVGDLMTTEPDAVTADVPISEVVEQLATRDYTALPVIDRERRVIGIISDTDMLSAGVTQLSVSLHKVSGDQHVRECLDRLRREGRTVREAMTTPAITVTSSTSLKDAAHLMHTRNLKRLPVVDENRRLVGVLGRLDVLKSVAAGFARRTVPTEARLPAEHAAAADVMDPRIVTVESTAPVADLIGRLLDAEVKRVLVVDDAGKLIGVVTDTDLVARVDPELRPGLLTRLRSRWNAAAHHAVERAYGQRAADVMTSPALAVAATASVTEALALTVERGLKRVPVIDANGRPVGIVARPALLAAALNADREGGTR
ncbi:DUF190 domain-containing protein [bacterium]|nr:DUF190 domain-containing protein [bacterium]